MRGGGGQLRAISSIVKATALEVLSEPLTLLVLLSALALAVFAPAFHYHQFGDATRMARDAGFSALLTGGLLVAIFGAVRSFRREIESGTLEMALAHPVSRTGFFLAKTAGVAVATLVFSLVVLGMTVVVFVGADIGGRIARESGDIARLFGPCLATGIGILVLPLVLGAALNRFAHFRFVLTSVVTAFGLSVAAAVVWTALTHGRTLRLVPVAIPIVLFADVFLSAAAAGAVRFKVSVVTAALGLLFLASVPVIGNYYLVDALGRMGTLPWSYVGWAALVTVPAVAAFLLLGVHFINGRDIQWTM